MAGCRARRRGRARVVEHPHRGRHRRCPRGRQRPRRSPRPPPAGRSRPPPPGGARGPGGPPARAPPPAPPPPPPPPPPRHDGDLAIALATGAVDTHLDRLRVVVTDLVAAAVRDAVTADDDG